jgi:hypothetical protein
VNRRWLGLAGLVLAVALLVMLRGGSSSNSPEHSSGSDAANGTSGLRLFADSLGYRSGTVEGDYTLPSSPALLFVFTPSQSSPFSNSEAQRLSSWLQAGNIVVYAAEDGDPILDSQFGLRRGSRAVTADGHAAAPILGGVSSLSGRSSALPLTPAQTQVPLIRNSSGDVLAVRLTLGSGQLIALTDPLPLCNGFLRLADNGRLAADLLALTPTGGRVLFDEYHHGAIAGNANPATGWMLTPWGAALLLAVVIVIGGLALRGRAFGPPIALRRATDRSSAEYATAVGGLLHRSGARQLTLETLLLATRRAVAERIGLGSDVPSEQALESIAQRSPAAARELSSATTELAQASTSESGVLEVARRLHRLAYPMAGGEPPAGRP